MPDTAVRNARDDVASLTPKWQEGEPPASTWVWRETKLRFSEGMTAVVVRTVPNPETAACEYHDFDRPVPWGTARWASIPKPTEG